MGLQGKGMMVPAKLKADSGVLSSSRGKKQVWPDAGVEWQGWSVWGSQWDGAAVQWCSG